MVSVVKWPKDAFRARGRRRCPRSRPVRSVADRAAMVPGRGRRREEGARNGRGREPTVTRQEAPSAARAGTNTAGGLLLLVASLGLLVGCSGEGDPAPGTAAARASGPASPAGL